MFSKKRLTVILVVIWAGLFATSFLLTLQIDGPRNIDTGFSRLDVLARYQVIALCVAFIAAIFGFLARKEGKRTMLVGFAPLLITGLMVIAIVAVTLVGNRPDPSDFDTRPKLIAPANDQPTQTD